MQRNYVPEQLCLSGDRDDIEGGLVGSKHRGSVSTVTAYVNPAAPEESFLNKNSFRSPESVFIIVGLLVPSAASKDLLGRLS